MDFPDRLRLPFAFDPARLRADLRALDTDPWYDHAVRQNYSGQWDVLALRAAAGETHPVRIIVTPAGTTKFADQPALTRCPYFREVLAAFACPLHAVRLMRLTPGSVIKEHYDHELGIEDGHARIHVPVTTNPQVDFRLNGARVDMAEGSAWYLRLSDPHSVINGGTSDHIHLVSMWSPMTNWSICSAARPNPRRSPPDVRSTNSGRP